MSVETLAIFGTPHIGVYIFTNDNFSLIPFDVPPKVENKVKETLGASVYKVSVAKSRLIGVLLAGNNNGLILPRIIQDDEINQLKQALGDVNFTVIDDVRETSMGNLILANDKGCVVSELLPKRVVANVSDTLGVECIQKSIGGLPLVGSVAVVTNKGLLLPPLVSEEELEQLSSFFGVEASVATINRGRIFLRSGIVANVHGALVGEETTGHEIMRIQQVLF